MNVLHSSRPCGARSKLAMAVTLASLALPATLMTDTAHAASAVITQPSSLIIVDDSYDSEVVTSAGYFSFKMKGDVDFTAAEDDIASIKGKASIKDTRNGHTREIRFEPGSNGGVARTYIIDGREHAFDDEGKRWLASAIGDAIRDSGLNADKRVKRLLKQGGPDAVLGEIDKMTSDNGRRLYIGHLAEDAKLDDRTVARVLVDISKMDGDFERRVSYLEILNTQNVNVTNMDMILSGVRKLESDFEKRSTLTALTRKLIADDSVRQGWVAAVKTIGSDFERRRVVTELTESNNPAIRVDWALASARDINSAFELRAALMAVSDKMQSANDAQVAAYAQAAKRIDSDFERRTALVALLDKAKLNHNGCVSMLDAIDGMGSDFEIRNTMVVLAKQMPADNELVARYHKIANKLSNDERDQVEYALAHPI